jgi:hypothetical protein
MLHKARVAKTPKVRPLDLANYLTARSESLAEAWASEIGARDLGQGTKFDAVVGRFMSQLTTLLPWLLGPHSSHVQPLWDRTAELFGVMAAKRALAAGEVIEEMQILRDLLIRTLYRDPPPEGALSLRDTLRINRIVDRGVTLASVGHTDAMFFQFFEKGESRAEPSAEAIIGEADTQLAMVEAELSQIVNVTPADGKSAAGN